MRFFSLLPRPRLLEQAQALHARVVEAARAPELYGDERAPDTLQGRLELVTVHAALCFLRLQEEQNGRALAQRFADVLFRELDAGLREAGVGDLTVPKKMRGIAKRFYGRLEAYRTALSPDAEQEALSRALARIIWQAPQHPFADVLAGRMRALHARHLAAGPEALALPQAWAAPSPLQVG